VTASPAPPEVGELRQLFRYLQELRSLYETQGIEEITTPSGRTWSLWDIEHLYEQARARLTRAQFRAIDLFLVQDHRESDAAELMGVSRTNPVGMYATLGLGRLLDAIRSGEIARFRPAPDLELAEHDLRRSRRLLHNLAGEIKKNTEVVLDDCWRYLPTPPGKTPRVRVRSLVTASGWLYLHPMLVMYAAHIGPVPADTRIGHRQSWPLHLACVNYAHAHLHVQPR
jgi:hypothetical protein